MTWEIRVGEKKVRTLTFFEVPDSERATQPRLSKHDPEFIKLANGRTLKAINATPKRLAYFRRKFYERFPNYSLRAQKSVAGDYHILWAWKK